MKMTESRFQAAIIQYAELNGWRVAHHPDLLARAEGSVEAQER